jgi:molybdopterin-binding protein
MKTGARNQLTGTITSIKRGDVMSQVKLEIESPATMQSVMTAESLADLGIKEGDQVRVVVKAVNVLLIKE